MWGDDNQTHDDSSPQAEAQTLLLRYMLSSMIQVRKLVAVELTYLGPKIIIAEYAIAVVVGLLVATLSLRAGLFMTHATWQTILGLYLLFVALTYAVLLGYALSMTRRGNSQAEIAHEVESNGTRATFRKYRRQSIWLLVPLAVPFVALKERRSSRHVFSSGQNK